MRRLEISSKAKSEIIDIRTFSLINWGQQQADKYVYEMHNTLALLQRNPLIGLTHDDLAGEIYSFPHASHVIYYQFDTEVLYLMAVLHKSMLPKNYLSDRVL